MKQIISILLCLIISFIPNSNSDYFVGKIVYDYSYTDLDGNDITSRMAPFLGKQQHYFTDGFNYKAYDENNKWVQLYNSKSNSYYFFNKSNYASLIDGTTNFSTKDNISLLEERIEILGYDCKALKHETDQSITIYYYSDAVKTNMESFKSHNFGGFNKLLEATDGALPLKFVTTDIKNGYIWTSTISSIEEREFDEKDFEFPAGYKL